MTTPNSINWTCEQFADALADFLERDVNEPTRAAMEAHALACAECGVLLADLRALRVGAANLPVLEPSRDLWSGVAERIQTQVVELPATRPGARRRAGNSAGRPHAGGRAARWMKVGLAAAALVGITATVTHEMTKRSFEKPAAIVVARPVVAQAQPTATLTSPGAAESPKLPSRPLAESPSRRPASGHPAESPSRLASNTKPSVEQTYASEIDHLHALLKHRRGELDSSTVAVIDKNLRIIDDAIVQCRKALKQDPNSRFLIESLNDALDSKVQLLRTAVALPIRM